MNSKQWGIAFTEGGGYPETDQILTWKSDESGKPLLWDDRDKALEACDLDGWRGYVWWLPEFA